MQPSQPLLEVGICGVAIDLQNIVPDRQPGTFRFSALND
jgi:hypothetical protein